MTDRPNILLVILDATRFDSCSCYGLDRPTTPHLDRLAAQGVLYEQAISAAPWTLPALFSILTGRYPNQSDIYQTRRVPEDIPTLAELLSAVGYATFCISGNSWLSSDFGMPRGFQTFHKLWQKIQVEDDITQVNVTQFALGEGLKQAAIKRMLQGNSLVNVFNFLYYRLVQRQDHGARRTLPPLKRWVEDQADGQPWLAFVHFLEAHLENKPPLAWLDRFARDPERARRLRDADQRRLFWRHLAGVEQLSDRDLQSWIDLYHAEVAYQDHYLGQILDWLDETGLAASTCVIVVADHGENLGEHGLVSHQYCLYDTLLRVPLILRHPQFFSGGARVGKQVQTIDLFQTILDMADAPATDSASKSLLSANDRAFTVAEYGRPSSPRPDILEKFDLRKEDFDHYLRALTAIRTDEYKLILAEDGTCELYAWPQDPYETHDLAVSAPEVTERLRRQLRTWQEENLSSGSGSSVQAQNLNPELAARLQALGYID